MINWESQHSIMLWTINVAYLGNSKLQPNLIYLPTLELIFFLTKIEKSSNPQVWLSLDEVPSIHLKRNLYEYSFVRVLFYLIYSIRVIIQSQWGSHHKATDGDHNHGTLWLHSGTHLMTATGTAAASTTNWHGHVMLHFTTMLLSNRFTSPNYHL